MVCNYDSPFYLSRFYEIMTISYSTKAKEYIVRLVVLMVSEIFVSMKIVYCIHRLNNIYTTFFSEFKKMYKSLNSKRTILSYHNCHVHLRSKESLIALREWRIIQIGPHNASLRFEKLV